MAFHLRFRRQRYLRRPTIGTLLMVFISVSLLPSLLPTHTLFSSSSSSINIIIEPPILLFAEATTNVAWKGNPNISPEHKAAHDAPRSQKYWDEHGIERPDYAKTDVEISAERGERGLFSSGGGSWFGFILLMVGIVSVASIAYARVTGDWDTITNNPAGAFVVNCINSTVEATGNKGNRLGSNTTAGATGNSASDAEQRRLARLARFDNSSSQTNMLDNMKEE